MKTDDPKNTGGRRYCIRPIPYAQALERLAAFEDMQEALAVQQGRVSEKNLAEMRAAGKEKTATFHQLLARRLTLIPGDSDRIHLYAGLPTGEP